jgi:hypothetical protein
MYHRWKTRWREVTFFWVAELTLTHELVHAYDHCRAYVDWSNCVHHACSEIRAANLSGDCSMYEDHPNGTAVGRLSSFHL